MKKSAESVAAADGVLPTSARWHVIFQDIFCEADYAVLDIAECSHL